MTNAISHESPGTDAVSSLTIVLPERRAEVRQQYRNITAPRETDTPEPTRLELNRVSGSIRATSPIQCCPRHPFVGTARLIRRIVPSFRFCAQEHV